MSRQFKALFVALISLAAISAEAASTTNLKQVEVGDGSQIELLFDGKVSPKQIRTEFFNDIIQISLTDVSVYPAKISSVSGSQLSKVFVYQYAPKLVRCRLTVKGKAESYQNKLQLKANGKVLTVRFDEAPVAAKRASVSEDKVVVKAAHPVAPPAEPRGSSAAAKAEVAQQEVSKEAPKPANTKAVTDVEDRVLLEKVMKHSPAGEKKAGKSTPLAGGKPLPSPLRSFGVLAVVIGLLGAFALFFRKFKGMRGGLKPAAVRAGNQRGLSGKLNRWMRTSLGVGGKEKMFEVVATHYLGPKKSIAMVRVAGRLLVLGVSNESINLITQLPDRPGAGAEDLDVASLLSSDHEGDSMIDPVMPAASSSRFADLLSTEKNKPMGYGATRAAGAVELSGVRAQIRSRIEGMKQL